MKNNSKIAKHKTKDLGYFRTATSMKASGMGKIEVEEESKFGRMAQFLKDIGKKILQMVLAD